MFKEVKMLSTEVKDVSKKFKESASEIDALSVKTKKKRQQQHFDLHFGRQTSIKSER